MSGVTLTPATVSLKVGATAQLTYLVSPTDASNQAVTFKSSSASATVDGTGKVTGVSAGTGTITVTTVDGSKTATTAFTVTE